MTERPLTIVVDTREPAIEAGDVPESVFSPRVFGDVKRGQPYADRERVAVPVVREKLDCGDYSLPGLESVVALERKSLLDLLSSLFGDGRNSSVGDARHNLDRFRAEIERAYTARLQLFAIVCEGDVAGLFKEARYRHERYGKSFDPFAALALLRSFAVDLSCPTIWCGSKGMAELEVGMTLARVWDQATNGPAALKARRRGYSIPWLGALADPPAVAS